MTGEHSKNSSQLMDKSFQFEKYPIKNSNLKMEYQLGHAILHSPDGYLGHNARIYPFFHCLVKELDPGLSMDPVDFCFVVTGNSSLALKCSK